MRHGWWQLGRTAGGGEFWIWITKLFRLEGRLSLAVRAGAAQAVESGFGRRRMLYLRIQHLKESLECRSQSRRKRKEGNWWPKSLSGVPYRSLVTYKVTRRPLQFSLAM